MPSDISRRDLLLGAGAIAGTFALPEATPAEPLARRRVLRIAHLCDIHIQPERRAGHGLAKCLEHVGRLRDRPDMILTGGDSVFDALTAGPQRVKSLWDLFGKVMGDFTNLPTKHCLGNHDIWPQAPRNSEDMDYQRKLACDELGLRFPYYTFDRDNWKVIVLDSTFMQGGFNYSARLDPTQYEWLRAEIRGTPKDRHILVVSHIPILTVTSFLFSHCERFGKWDVPGRWMHTDARLLKNMFYKAGNVQLCVSGHMHMVDRVDYLGTTYMCNGAVSGNWWGGKLQETEEGYALINLYSDGTFDREYVTYGWKAVAT